MLKNLLFAAAILFSSVASFANTNPTLSLDEGKVLVVNLNDWVNSNVEISIKDLNGAILHNDSFQNKSTVGRKYNLKNLPYGQYTLVIESADKKAIHKLEVTNNTVEMQPLSSKMIFKPHVTINENSISLNLLALGEDMFISISDQNEPFFSVAYKNMSTVNKRFDTSELPAGRYLD